MLAYHKTITALILPLGLLLMILTEVHLVLWAELLPLFEWLEGSLLGVIGKTWGAVFAVVQAFHLIGLVIIGGCVLLFSASALGLAFEELGKDGLLAQCDRLFSLGLVLSVATGVFMSCAVALKIYYLPVFWYKMLALLAGVLFHYGIMRPVMSNDSLPAATVRLCGVACAMVWFTVAATGRWIGFSG